MLQSINPYFDELIIESGYGRELSEFGIKEFVNIIAVYVKQFITYSIYHLAAVLLSVSIMFLHRKVWKYNESSPLLKTFLFVPA